MTDLTPAPTRPWFLMPSLVFCVQSYCMHVSVFSLSPSRVTSGETQEVHWGFGLRPISLSSCSNCASVRSEKRVPNIYPKLMKHHSNFHSHIYACWTALLRNTDCTWILLNALLSLLSVLGIVHYNPLPATVAQGCFGCQHRPSKLLGQFLTHQPLCWSPHWASELFVCCCHTAC